jgi:hypothetical protein
MSLMLLTYASLTSLDVKGNSISCQRTNGVEVSLGHGEVTGHLIPG